MEERVLEQIMTELQELRQLYKTLVDKLVPVEEALKDEVKAIESEDEYVDELELMKALECSVA